MQKEYRWILIEHDESAILIFDRLLFSGIQNHRPGIFIFHFPALLVNKRLVEMGGEKILFKPVHGLGRKNFSCVGCFCDYGKRGMFLHGI
mgnify:CR=1 FL=1